MTLRKIVCPTTQKKHAKIDFENHCFCYDICLLPKLSTHLEGIQKWQILMKSTSLQVTETPNREKSGSHSLSHCWHVFHCMQSCPKPLLFTVFDDRCSLRILKKTTIDQNQNLSIQYDFFQSCENHKFLCKIATFWPKFLAAILLGHGLFSTRFLENLFFLKTLSFKVILISVCHILVSKVMGI